VTNAVSSETLDKIGSSRGTLSPSLVLGVPSFLRRSSAPNSKRHDRRHDNHSKIERTAARRILVREDETLAKVDCPATTGQHPAAHSAPDVAGASVGRPRVSRDGHSQAESQRMRRTERGTIPGRHSEGNCVGLSLPELSGKRKPQSHPKPLRTQNSEDALTRRSLRPCSTRWNLES